MFLFALLFGVRGEILLEVCLKYLVDVVEVSFFCSPFGAIQVAVISTEQYIK